MDRKVVYKNADVYSMLREIHAKIESSPRSVKCHVETLLDVVSPLNRGRNPQGDIAKLQAVVDRIPVKATKHLSSGQFARLIVSHYNVECGFDKPTVSEQTFRLYVAKRMITISR